MPSVFSRIIHTASQDMGAVEAGTVDLIVTSPPYPMIEMWDDCFARQSEAVRDAMQAEDWQTAFERMHETLDGVWSECDRVLRDNGFVCINIGDATRTCGGDFRLFSNHARILRWFEQKGYSVLPDIHWRKQSNAPNKFMGSGMFPAGAYVTYEHEYILIFRKGGKRVFKGEALGRRRESAYFWEERNVWFSDLWEVRGTAQAIENCTSRGRSAAFPFEIPYRLVNMYSAYGDTVLDPFGGLGTTALACAALQRNCISCEMEEELCACERQNLLRCVPASAKIVRERRDRHLAFIDSLDEDTRGRCYQNRAHGFLVKTRQEMGLTLYRADRVEPQADGGLRFYYEQLEQAAIR